MKQKHEIEMQKSVHGTSEAFLRFAERQTRISLDVRRGESTRKADDQHIFVGGVHRCVDQLRWEAKMQIRRRKLIVHFDCRKGVPRGSAESGHDENDRLHDS